MTDQETIREYGAELRRIMSAMPGTVALDRRRDLAVAQIALRKPQLHRGYIAATNRHGVFARSTKLGGSPLRSHSHGVVFEARNSGATTELLIYDTIGDDGAGGGIGAKDFATKLQAINSSRINVRINSVGGSVFDAIAIHNSLERHKARIEVDIEGVALSAASVIAMAGDEIRMADNALMMIHDPWTIGIGDSGDMRKAAESLDRIKDTIVSTYVKRTGHSASKIAAWMKDETWFTADEAIKLKFAHRKTGAVKVAALGDLSKFKNVPAQLRNR